jgi:ATP-dependent DNA helicase HFM1/MER3
MTWRGGGLGYQEIEAGTLLQMMGRAGRPGLDTSGTAVIMTDNKSKDRIEQLTSGLGAADSQIVSKLVEVINCEISQRVITSLDGALQWMKSTLLFLRLKEEPERYGVQIASEHSIDSHLLGLCSGAIGELRDIGAIGEDEETEIFPLAASHIISQSMVPFAAMKLIAALPFDATQCQILKVLSQVESYPPVRRHEKKHLNECHKDIKYKLDGPPSKVRVQSPSEKAFVLLQANIGQYSFEDYTLKQEMGFIVDTASRVLSAAQEFSVRGSQNGQVAFQSLKLRRSLETCLWSEKHGVLNQFGGNMGVECTRKLMFNGIKSFEDVLASTDESIAKASGLGISFGKELRGLVSQTLREKLQISGAAIEYTRGSNLPAGVVCELKPFKDILNNIDSTWSTSPKRRSTVHYTLVRAAE